MDEKSIAEELAEAAHGNKTTEEVKNHLLKVLKGHEGQPYYDDLLEEAKIIVAMKKAAEEDR